MYVLDEHDAKKLPWMPKELPAHVKIVFSCLPDDKYNVLEAFKKYWGAHEENMIEIGKLPVRKKKAFQYMQLTIFSFLKVTCSVLFFSILKTVV